LAAILNSLNVVEESRRLRRPSSSASALDDAHDVAFLHDQQVFAVELDFGARPLAEQDAVAALTSSAISLPLSSRAPGRRRRLRPPGLFLGGVGDDDAALGLSWFFLQ
jgi:hypothetical protein